MNNLIYIMIYKINIKENNLYKSINNNINIYKFKINYYN